MNSIAPRILDYPRITLVVLLTALSVPWFFFGVQLQDMGWQLSKSWLVMEHPEEAYWDAAWLSNVIPGLWMKAGGYSLLWMRFGYVPVIAGTFLILYQLLCGTYSRVEVLLALVLTWLLSSAGANTFVADYYIVPPLFGLGSIAAFHRAGVVQKRRFLWLFASGLLFALLIQARVPSVIIVLFYPTVILVSRLTSEKESNPTGYRWSDLVPVLCGIGFGLIVIALILDAFGLFEVVSAGVVESLQQGSSNEGRDNIHHPLRLITDSVTRYGKAIGVGGGILFGVWVFNRIVLRDRDSLSAWVVPLLMIPVAVVTAWLAVSGRGMFPPAIGVITIVALAVIWREWRRGWSDRLFLILSGVIYLVMMNAGSSNPQVGSLKFTILLVAPVVLIEIYRAAFGGDAVGRIIGLILCTNIVVLWLSTRMFYGGSIFDYTEMHQIEGLAGVYAEPSQVRDLETVVSRLREVGLREGDRSLMFVDIPMLHFVTRTIPSLKNSWISSYAVGYPDERKMIEMIGQVKQRGELPEWVVRAPDDIAMGENSARKIRTLDSILSSENYDTILVTEEYAFLKRSE